MAASVFGKSAPKAAVAFKAPEREDTGEFVNIDLKSVAESQAHPYDGKTFVISVKGPESVQTKSYGIKTAIKADVLVADTGERFTDQLLFNKAAVDLLPPYSGQDVIVGVSTYTAHGKRHIDFVEPTDEQQALGTKALDQPPF